MKPWGGRLTRAKPARRWQPGSPRKRLGEAFQAGGSGSLEQDDVVAAQERAQRCDRRVQVGEPETGGAAGGAVEVAAGAWADRDQQVDPELGRLPAGERVPARRLGAELGHRAEP